MVENFNYQSESNQPVTNDKGFASEILLILILIFLKI